jgi:hypothetical protein
MQTRVGGFAHILALFLTFLYINLYILPEYEEGLQLMNNNEAA